MLADIDYTCGMETDNLVQLGNVGFSDCRRRFIPTIYDLNKTENSIGAGRILSLFAMLVKKMDGHCGIALKDVAMALSKACDDNNLLEADCLAHKARMKSWSTRSSGTRGSLETHCLKIGASNMEIKILTSIMLGLDSLPTRMEWSFGVALLELHLYKENFSFATNEKAMRHLMKCYFPSVPRYGTICALRIHFNFTFKYFALRCSLVTLKRFLSDLGNNHNGGMMPYISYISSMSLSVAKFF